ncbi:MAG: tRNA (adenosine(37)-N6)-threonylcarbamoyltransferase complex ATPase subunit type 1 TsaE [Woeseiaceae bacterium]
MADLQLTLADDVATTALGADLADAVVAVGLKALAIALDGDLGAGKTTLSRGFLRALGHTGPVPSPTYTLLEPYQFDQLTVNHLDLYRLADGSELDALGWRDIGDSIRLVEWPSRAPEVLAQMDLVIQLAWYGDGRSARLVGQSHDGDAVLRQLGS